MFAYGKLMKKLNQELLNKELFECFLTAGVNILTINPQYIVSFILRPISNIHI